MKIAAPLFLLLVYISLPCTAQYMLSGKIINERQEALPAASILLLDPEDSTLLQTGFADNSGLFALSLPDSDRSYLLEVQMMGYDSWLRLLPPGERGGLGPLMLLSAAQELQQVTISGRKALIERKPDRTVFNVAQSITAIGSDAWDVLKKAPGVQISRDQVGIAGKSTVQVMINDRLVQLDGNELEAMLRSIPAGNISKIEVITAPPARYDAAGNSGIIHIITKKTVASGLNGNITLTYTQKTKSAQGLQSNLNYRKGKLNLYGTANFNRMRFVSRQEIKTEYPAQVQEQVLNQDNRPFFTWSQAGADYYLTENSVLGLVFTLGTMDGKREERIRSQVSRRSPQLVDSLLRTDAFSTDKGQRKVIDLNYEWKIDTSGKKLSINLDYFHRRGDKERNFVTGAFFTDGQATGQASDNHTLGTQLTRIATARADLAWPTKLALFTAGGKLSFINNNSDNIFTYLSNGVYINDAGKTNTFDYKENTQALYVSAQRSEGAWHAQLGLRAEYTRTRGLSPTLGQANTNAYFQLFPSAYLQYKPGETHSWNLNYTRRIDRPSFWDMNPFRIYSTATAYEEGNPFLQPSFSNNIELGYAFRSILAFTLYMQKTDDFATRVSRIDTFSNTFYFGQANAGDQTSYGMSASFNIAPLRWWEHSTQLYGSYTRFSSGYYATPVRYGRAAFSIETNNTFTLNTARTLMAELGWSWYSRQQSDFDIQHSHSNLSAGLKLLLYDKRLVLALNASDLLRTDVWIMENLYNGTYQNSYFDERSLRIALSWKFGNRDIKARRERSTSPEEAGRSN